MIVKTHLLAVCAAGSIHSWELYHWDCEISPVVDDQSVHENFAAYIRYVKERGMVLSGSQHRELMSDYFRMKSAAELKKLGSKR